jgi:pseudaminic acid synthase
MVVAELSANHGGSLEVALDTVRAAARAGADAIKIQTYRPDTITIDAPQEHFIVRGGLWDGRTLYELYEEAHTPWDWHEPIFAAADEVGLPVFSTPFDRSAVELLESLEVPAYKIASFELVDLELVRAVARTHKPIIMSTGMATLEEIARSVSVIRDVWGDGDPGLALLRCVSAYPASPRDMNLRTIARLEELFSVIPGLSDHTLGTAVATTAVAFGARVIEKHFTLDRAAGGPDAAFSMEPEEFRRLVDDVRMASEAIGEVRFGPAPGDRASTAFRRSIFVVHDVEAGEPFTRENVRVIRPGHGLPPHLLPVVLGRRARARCVRGTPLTGDWIEGWASED